MFGCTPDKKELFLKSSHKCFTFILRWHFKRGP